MLHHIFMPMEYSLHLPCFVPCFPKASLVTAVSPVPGLMPLVGLKRHVSWSQPHWVTCHTEQIPLLLVWDAPPIAWWAWASGLRSPRRWQIPTSDPVALLLSQPCPGPPALSPQCPAQLRLFSPPGGWDGDTWRWKRTGTTCPAWPLEPMDPARRFITCRA